MTTHIVYAFGDASGNPIERGILAGQDVDYAYSNGVDSAESRAILRQADILVIALEKITGEVMDAMPNCRLISRLGVGIDNIDTAAATKRGIWVGNIPDYGTDEVATHAIALLMTLLRGIRGLSDNTRAGRWESAAMRPIHRLTSLTLGVMGFGRIGRTAGNKGKGLGMRVIAYDPFLSADDIRAAGAEPVTQDELFKQADFITLHLPLDVNTKHTINARTLDLMKPNACLVNTARGGLVDEAALLDAVNAGRIRGAGLDVLSTEPPQADNATLQALMRHERVIVTPHTAWYSEEAQIDMRTRAAEDILRALKGEPPRMPVNDVSGVKRG
jgi:D-3-phosphoglycerate dehydrogenase